MRSKLLIIATTALSLLSTPALAHDQLIEISPAPGEVIATSSFEAVLTFDNPLLVIEGQTNAALETKPAESADWVTHPITINGNILTAQVNLTETGSYDLRWNVVSSDGHPISGESTFEVDAAATLGSEEIAITSEEPEAVAFAQPVAEAGSDEIPAGFYIGLLMVALGAVFAPIGLMMRRKSKKS
jgi:methionine-rich copper-binding protein CopC